MLVGSTMCSVACKTLELQRRLYLQWPVSIMTQVCVSVSTCGFLTDNVCLWSLAPQLNLLAGRSYSDLNQYPVMPWVLADYTSPRLDLNSGATFRDLSRPMGAQEERRAQFFRDRYDSLQARGWHA